MTEASSTNRRRLTAAQQALLDERLRGRTGDPQAVSRRRDPGTPVPVTPLQAQIWALAQSHPDVSAYNMHRALRFEGQLDIDALRRAVATVVERHEALKTVFEVRDRDIVQIFQPGNHVELQVENTDDSLKRAEAEVRRPFDLGSGPLIRFLLLEEVRGRHLFIMVVHHIIADEWSLDICLDELNKTFNGKDIENAAPPQYGDYVLQKLDDIDRNSQRHVAYWQRKLADVDHTIQLPADHPRPPVQTFNGCFLRIAADPELIRQLAAVAAQLDVTPFVLMFTAYAALLARLSEQTRFVVGVPSANRVGGRAETAVGLFVASLPLPCRMEPDITFSECVEASKKNFLDAMMNLDFAFDDLLTAIGCDRTRGGNPLFQTMFVLETDSLARLEWSGVRAERVELDYGCAKFDWTLFVNPSTSAPSFAIEFNTALFTAATADRILASYGRVLQQIASDPECPIGRLDIVPEEMRHQLLSDFGQGPPIPDSPSATTLPEQVLAVAASTPDAVAIVFEERQLTYAELVDEAGRLSARLRDNGVTAGDLVGLFVERSPEQIIALLGIQLAGAAYVPLDSGYPAERLDVVFDDLAASTIGSVPHVVTVAALASRLRRDVSVVLVDAGDDVRPEPYTTAPVNPASPAYVIYTSGSTGRPKGVVVAHANLAASTAARHQYYDFPDRFLLVPSFAFDSSVAGLFWTLSCGGTLIMASEADSRDPVVLGRIIDAAKVTHTLMLPSLWQWTLLNVSDGRLRSLKSVIVAGEACSGELVDLHHSLIPAARLYNEYGPTEATVWASVHCCDHEAHVATTVPIGQPIAGSHLYVLDRIGNLVPVGVDGELCIGGAGVTGGYLNRPDETTARFVSNPHARNKIIYRTGDLARWRADGALEFVGRVDDQLKLRGYRIEPGDIESRLLAHPAIEECGVTVVAQDTVDNLDMQRTIELAERLPQSLVEKLLLRIEKGEHQK